MTNLTISRRLCIALSLATIAFSACAGAHAARAHARNSRLPHSSVRKDSAPPEVKPLVGELMA